MLINSNSFLPLLFLKDGRFREALGEWETALTLMPERAVLHEQKAQVLLEIGESWNALKAANSESLFFIFYVSRHFLIILNNAVTDGHYLFSHLSFGS